MSTPRPEIDDDDCDVMMMLSVCTVRTMCPVDKNKTVYIERHKITINNKKKKRIGNK
jgi:hypothetical protein